MPDSSLKIAEGLILGGDGALRCWWPDEDPEYIKYHDEEWGRGCADDIHLFEKICLEGFQAGLSWLTILRKRENFRRAFDGFDFKKVELYTDKDVERLVQDAGIVRHRGKIKSTINNAKQVQILIKEFGSLEKYFWSFAPNPKDRPAICDYAAVMKMDKTPESTALSKDLKKRGWSFVGPTTCYAFMQSVGIVNDHVEGCFCRRVCENKK